jgi:hypothetical protein
MASTAAVDVRFVESWSDDDLRAETGSKPAQSAPAEFAPAPQPGFQPSGGPSVPPWMGRRLGDALADLGPARPYADALENAVSQASLERAAAALAPAAGGSVMAPLPPPPRPTRTVQPFQPADGFDGFSEWRSSSGFDLNWPTAQPIANYPDDRHDVVRALADLAPPTGQAATLASLARAAQNAPIDPDERPPMIIERARVEQELGLSLDEVSARLNPVPGLAVGGVMALMTGVILYLVMTAA